MPLACILFMVSIRVLSSNSPSLSAASSSAWPASQAPLKLQAPHVTPRRGAKSCSSTACGTRAIAIIKIIYETVAPGAALLLLLLLLLRHELLQHLQLRPDLL
jgi:hypothetical protein